MDTYDWGATALRTYLQIRSNKEGSTNEGKKEKTKRYNFPFYIYSFARLFVPVS